MFSLFLLSWLRISTGTVTKQTVLSPQTPAPNDSSITLNPESTSTAAGIYYLVRVRTQDSYDLKLSFDNSYGFDPSFISTFTLSIDGFTPFIDKTADLLFMFTVSNRYFAFLLHLSQHSTYAFNQIYFPSNSSQNVTEILKTNNNSISNRYKRISENNEWISFNRHQSLWPLKFVVTNNPKQQNSMFQFYHNTSTLSVTHTFDTLFAPNKDIDIYIMGNAYNEQFYISSFDITTDTHISTHKPTFDPTPEPTHKPTQSPKTSIPDLHTTNDTTNSETNAPNSTLIHKMETPKKQSFITELIKSQAVIVISIVLFGICVFCLGVLMIRKYSKSVLNINGDRKDSGLSDNECDGSGDEYMNEGMLSPTGGVGVGSSAIKHNMFVIESRKNGIIFDKKPSVSSTVLSEQNSRSEKDMNREESKEDTIGSKSVSSDKRIRRTNANSESVVPLTEKQNMDRFIQITEDLLGEDDKCEFEDNVSMPSRKVSMVSRQVSDEMNCCVSFNYCNEMLL